MEYKTISKPFLIQRGSFKDIPEDKIVGLDSLIHYDYMGSSEFEWGALPKALKVMTSNWKDYVNFQIDSIRDNEGQYLQVLCNKSQAEEIKDLVINLFSKDCQIHLKERTGMYDYLACKSTYALNTNFWWDVTGNDYHDHTPGNSWMCCFGDDIRRLIIAIRKVWCKHNSAEVSVPQPQIDIKLGLSQINVTTASNMTSDNKAIIDKKDIPDSSVHPDFGPEIPVKITKPKPSKLLIESNRNQYIVTTTDGHKTIINKNAIRDISVYPDKLVVTVKNKAGLDRVLNIQAEASNQRKVLENMITEQKEWLCRSM